MAQSERDYASVTQHATFACRHCGRVFEQHAPLADLTSGKTTAPCKTCGAAANAISIDAREPFCFPNSRSP